MQETQISRRSFIGGGFALAGAAIAGSLALAGCSGSTGASPSASSSSSAASSAAASAAGGKQALKIACLAREEPDIDFIANQLSGKYDLEAVVFGDNNAINEATLDGSVDGNLFQNISYLDSWNKSKGTDLVYVGQPAFYTCDILVSRKYKSLSDIPDGASILVANDNANRARELRLLEAAGLITLNDSDQPTVLDIVDNPKNLQIQEVDPRSRVGAFPDVDAMVSPTITVYQMNDPEVTVEDALATEAPDVYKSFGGTILVVTKDNQNATWIDDFEDAIESDAYTQFLKDTYHGAKIPASEG